MDAWIAKREKETGISNPMLTQGDWHGHKGVGAFKSSEQAYNTLHIGDVAAAQSCRPRTSTPPAANTSPATKTRTSPSLITVIGRGHGGTRAMSHTLSQSGVYMGNTLNGSGDLIPPEEMYEACRVMAKHVKYKGDLQWDFSKLHTMPIDPEFEKLIKSYLKSVLRARPCARDGRSPKPTCACRGSCGCFRRRITSNGRAIRATSILSGHVTDNLDDFGVPHDKTDDIRLLRATSWLYQAQIIRDTPKPKHWLSVRFEDFVLDQEPTLKKLSDFLGFPLVKIPVDPSAVGRWKQDKERHDFDFLETEMKEYGYLDAAAKGKPKASRKAKPRRRAWRRFRRCGVGSHVTI